MRCCLLILAAALLHPVFAQERGIPEDSLRSYNLAEIVITNDETAPESPSTLQKVSLAELTRMDAGTVSDVARLIPATHVQTNSRGESLLYLRNAGERQVALFFNGALLNVPWDNRVDMSLIPTSVIGGITVTKGVPSVLFGANVLGGAVNMTSRTLDHPGVYTEIAGQAGFPRMSKLSLTHIRRHEGVYLTGSLGYLDRDGDALASDANLPFSQNDSEIRTNTDRRLLSVFGQGGYDFRNGSRLGIALLMISGEKGVAPEGHLNPENSRVRYWRYPIWTNTMVIVNGETRLGPSDTMLRGAVWGTRFGQTIQQYNDASFVNVTDEEAGTDYVLGSRLILSKGFESGQIALAFNGTAAHHAQEKTEFEFPRISSHRASIPIIPPISLIFGHYLLSAGVEYQWMGPNRSTFIFGASLDGMFMPITGDKPSRDPFFDYGLTAGWMYRISPEWSMKASAGRKIRFPTMRELFGEALKRFQVNPDLRPETSFLSEFGFSHQDDSFTAGAAAFFARTYDTIDQRVLGDERRQRINLEGSRVYGVETYGSVRLVPRLQIDGHLTWTSTVGFNERREQPLTEKPVWLGTMTVLRTFSPGITLMIQSVYTGKAYSLDNDAKFKRLNSSLVLNARAAYRKSYALGMLSFCEFYVRINNITDEVMIPQLGLPAPGRELQIGVTLVP